MTVKPKTTDPFDLKSFLTELPMRPGIYQMLGEDEEVLYVGKAKNLKKRVSSYFSRQKQNLKTQSLIQHIHHIEIIVTTSDTEALLLESNLIKQYKPRYNVLLRDDKSYPYLHLSDQAFPRLSFYRGARSKKGQFFGPYPSSSAVRATLHLLQKIFKLRQCDDIFFQNRTRPCLQYQIKRCSAPCVGYIDQEHYAKDIEAALIFLRGKNQTLYSHFYFM